MHIGSSIDLLGDQSQETGRIGFNFATCQPSKRNTLILSPPISFLIKHLIIKLGGTGHRFGGYQVVDCVSGRNQLRNTKFTRPNTKILKLTHNAVTNERRGVYFRGKTAGTDENSLLQTSLF